ncbi:MAG: tRNA pseudouridine(13) synthase TruD [Phycisphaeraceae bacterium]|nr:tRNA pseudouridine(13) synthase TruD [Phycisphaeraceae bacterium]
MSENPLPVGPISLETDPHVSPSIYITSDLPGIGGVLKQRPEDFLVDETAAYQPSGEGDHLYLYVEKRNLSTLEAARLLASHFGVAPDTVGFAGMKDRVAITRQLFSVHTPGKAPEDFPQLDHERLQVQWADRHTNKIRLGHLTGNRFSIRIREVGVGQIRTAKAALDRLAKFGVPNRFGPQRFGRTLNNHLIGRALICSDFEGAIRLMLAPEQATTEAHAKSKALFLEGRYGDALAELPHTSHAERSLLRALAKGQRPSRAIKTLDRSTLRFFLSAFQSAAFNFVLDDRLKAGTLNQLHTGDVAFKHDSRACFDVDDAVASDPTTPERLTKFEISPSGPMWSAEMRRASGNVDATETAALERLGVTMGQLQAFEKAAGQLIEGARRPLRVPLEFPEIEAGLDEHGQYIRVAFDLPRGAFATVALEEIMKVGRSPAQGAESTDEGHE